MKRYLILLSIHCLFISAFGQTTKSLVNEVSLDSLVKTVREFSGEDSTTFNDTTVRIVHRVSKRNNNLAADYLVHRLKSYGIETQTVDYRTRGRNVIGTILGKTHPDSVVFITAHYDAVADYCADDNASGSATVLEAARIMSQRCFHNTIKFVFWDEEELGLIGSKYYANAANARGDKIVSVLNMDMMGYDGDSNKVFDIHTNSNPENQRIKDTVLYLLDFLELDLVPNVINPGTTRSDHASFWKHRYPAIFCGESFIGGDPNPAYHTSKDRIDLFDLGYFHKLSKLAIGLTVEMTGVIPAVVERDTIEACFSYDYKDTTFLTSTIYREQLKTVEGCDSIYEMNLQITTINDSIATSDIGLKAFDTASNYQWVRCSGTSRIPMFQQTDKEFRVLLDDYYAVVLEKNGCVDTSECVLVTLTGVEKIQSDGISIYPNPTDNFVTLQFGGTLSSSTILVYNATYQLVSQPFQTNLEEVIVELPASPGMYYIRVLTDAGSKTFKVVKLSN